MFFLTGLVFTYCLEQISMWAMLHAVFLFWGVRYPFNYRQLRVSGRIRYTHIISVVLAIVVPLFPALINLKGGYVLTTIPSLACAGRSTEYIYYTIILPVSVILAIITCLLALIVWTIYLR